MVADVIWPFIWYDCRRNISLVYPSNPESFTSELDRHIGDMSEDYRLALRSGFPDRLLTGLEERLSVVVDGPPSGSLSGMRIPGTDACLNSTLDAHGSIIQSASNQRRL